MSVDGERFRTTTSSYFVLEHVVKCFLENFCLVVIREIGVSFLSIVMTLPRRPLVVFFQFLFSRMI